MRFEKHTEENKVSDISEGHRIRIEEKIEQLQKSNFPEVKETILIAEKILHGEAVRDHTIENTLLILRSKMLMAQNLQDREAYKEASQVLEDSQAYVTGVQKKKLITAVIEGSEVERGEVVQLNTFRKDTKESDIEIPVRKKTRRELTESELKDESREFVTRLQQGESFDSGLVTEVKALLRRLEDMLLEKNPNIVIATYEQSRDTYDLLGVHEELEAALRRYEEKFREI